MMTQDSQAGVSGPLLPEIPNWLCLCFLALFCLVLLSKVLFVSPHEVLSDEQLDVARFFLHWRYFGFHELKSGNFPLWNPHLCCGEPFFGNFQSALLYPLNFLYLLLPLVAAMNWTIALHVFLGGAFTFYWVRQRGMHSLACLLSAMMFMFCGPHFLQIQAGHLPNLCALIWAPLLFLSIDQLSDRPTLEPCLLGMFTLAMMILAGHPQYVFYLGVAAGLYAILNLARAGDRGRIMLGWAAIVLGGAALSAVQLFTGLGEGSETVRSVGLSYGYASTFSFPPENILTLVAPRLFGDGNAVPYWGRAYVTETSLFVSVIGLVLAAYGMARGPRSARRFSITLLIIMLVLALGGHTPVFHWLYDYVPGFKLFRGMDKFLWLAALFLSMLAGVGLDQLLRGRDVPGWLIGGVTFAALVLCGLSLLPLQADWWSRLMRCLTAGTMKIALNFDYTGPAFVAQAKAQYIRSLLEGAVYLFLAAGLLFLAKSRRRLACAAMLVMAVVELASFADTSLMTFEPGTPYPPAILQFLASQPGDHRILYSKPNNAMTAGTLDIGGDDPSGLLRYVRYFYFTEGLNYDATPFGKPGPLVCDVGAWRILRCRYAFQDSRPPVCARIRDPLPRLILVERFRVMTDYHAMFFTLTNQSFDPGREVILEDLPNPPPAPDQQLGAVRLLDSSTDYLTVEADTAAPCLLLNTDAYSKGWRARPLPGSSQAAYQIMPADYCLRAIPLAAGHHLLRLEYSPLGFRVGKVVSFVAWAIFLPLVVLAMRRSKFPVQPHAQD
jgi:hypothetical protein